MANERLRAALLEKGMTLADLAYELEVNTKTVERWVNGRLPYRKYRYQVASRLGLDEVYLWPDALPRDQVTKASASEILAVYPHRSEVPRDVWRRHFEGAEEEIGVLVYAGLFLAEDRGLLGAIRKKAAAGVRVRFLLGDPDDAHVLERGIEEGVAGAMPVKVRNAMVLYAPLIKTGGVEFRAASHCLVQLDLPCRRGCTRQHPRVRVPSTACTRLAFQEGRRRRAGDDVPRELRTRLGNSHTDAGGLMARRIDFYDDPAAPPANSLVPSVNVIVENESDEILMIQRSDNGNWAVPGGAIDLGESMTDAAVRETREETGIDCEITGLVGIYTDPKHIVLYTSNGEARQEFSILLKGRVLGGTPTPSDESTRVEWLSTAGLSDLQMDRSMRVRIEHFLQKSDRPRLL